MDRLNILKERVFISISEYRTLIESLEKSFKFKNTLQTDHLLLIEKEIIKTLDQRYRIFCSYPGFNKNYHKDLFDELTLLYNDIDSFRNRLTENKKNLKNELSNVKQIIRPLGKSRDAIAGRIDIIT